jgi:hypothetical protein
VTLEEAERAARAAVLSLSIAHDALTSGELESAQAQGSRAGAVLSFYPGRTGDIYYEMAPYILEDEGSNGTSHGTPWAYDQQVPLMFFGRGIVPGIRRTPATVADLAPTLSAILGLTAPGGSQGRVLAEALR